MALLQHVKKTLLGSIDRRRVLQKEKVLLLKDRFSRGRFQASLDTVLVFIVTEDC
jgi:hypothetical protein